MNRFIIMQGLRENNLLVVKVHLCLERETNPFNLPAMGVVTLLKRSAYTFKKQKIYYGGQFEKK